MHNPASQTDRWLIRALLVSLVLFANPWATLGYAALLHNDGASLSHNPDCHAGDQAAKQTQHATKSGTSTATKTDCNGCDTLSGCDICTMGCCTCYSVGVVAPFPNTRHTSGEASWLSARGPDLILATPSSPFHPPRP